MALPLRDLLVALHQQAKEFAFMFRPFVFLDADHDRGRSAPLGDHHGLTTLPDSVENVRGGVAQIADRDDGGDLAHVCTPKGTSKRTIGGSSHCRKRCVSQPSSTPPEPSF